MDTNHSPIISPLTMRESARGITLTSIYDEMLARRELSVMGNIETPMAHDLCQQIRLLDATEPSRPITIFVASAGGSVRSGLAIYDAMRLASCPIRSGLTPKRIQSLTAKDTYLSAERAVELGFAHVILSTTKEVAHA